MGMSQELMPPEEKLPPEKATVRRFRLPMVIGCGILIVMALPVVAIIGLVATIVLDWVFAGLFVIGLAIVFIGAWRSGELRIRRDTSS